MQAQENRHLFIETGAPEAYLLYSRQVKSEAQYVREHSGHRPQSYGLQ